MNECCEACRFWKRDSGHWIERDRVPNTGQCHRFPPQHVHFYDKSWSQWGWPETYDSYWCGEFARSVPPEEPE